MRYSTHNVPIWPYGLQVLAPPKVQNSKSEADQISVREATYQNFIQQAKLLICKYIYNVVASCPRVRGLSSGAFLFKTISPGWRSIRPTTQNKLRGAFTIFHFSVCCNEYSVAISVTFSISLPTFLNPTSHFSTSRVAPEWIPLCVTFQMPVSTHLESCKAPPMHPISPRPKTFMCIGVAKEEASCSHAHIPGAHCTILGHSSLVYVRQS